MKKISYFISILLVLTLFAGSLAGCSGKSISEYFSHTPSEGDEDYRLSQDKDLVSQGAYSYYYVSVYRKLVRNAVKNNSGFSIINGNCFYTDRRPDAQVYITGDVSTTFAGYISSRALEAMEATVYYLAIAEDEGCVIDEEGIAAVENTMSDYKILADDASLSLDKYLKQSYGKGVTASVMRKLLTAYYTVAGYLESAGEELKKTVTDEEINQVYSDNPLDYQYVDIRVFAFDIPRTYTNSEEYEALVKSLTGLAENFRGKIRNQSNFAELARRFCDESDADKFADDNATLQQGMDYYSACYTFTMQGGEWLFSPDRKAGDTVIIPASERVYIIMMVTPATRDESIAVDADCIFISNEKVKDELCASAPGGEVLDSPATATDGTPFLPGGAYPAPVLADCYGRITKIYTEYSKSATQGAFEKLRDTYSDLDEDYYYNRTARNTKDDIATWLFDENRQPGDVLLANSSEGYAFFRFRGVHGEPVWKENIRETVSTDIITLFEQTNKESYFGSLNPQDYTKTAAKALETVNSLYVISTDKGEQ